MKILIADDDDVTRKLLHEVLEKEGYDVRTASSGEAALEALAKETFPIVLTDVRMLETDGYTVLREVKRKGIRSAVILMTGFGSVDGAIEAVKDGAFDYVSKPFSLTELKAVVGRASKHWEALKTQRESFAEIDVGAEKALIGRSPRIVEVYKTLARATLSPSNVLVRGESGTGKELVARAIHGNSDRRRKRFVTLNCNAFAEVWEREETLLKESEGGTLFLDEVAEVSPAFQARLLRLMDSGVRIIAATQRDLESLVRTGRFREDLFYRIKVISIELPPLRDRIEDLPELVSHFLAIYSAKNRKKVSHVSEEAMARLRAYSWPGNIRELEYAIERAVALSSAPILFVEDFEEAIAPASGGLDTAPVAGSLEEMEKAHISRILTEVGFNKSKASEVLGIDRATLYRKAQRYGIDLAGPRGGR